MLALREHRLDKEVEQLCSTGDALAPNLWRHVLPLFSRSESSNGRLALIGSAVLVDCWDELFLFSAAHVLAEFKAQAFYTVANEMILPITGEYQFRFRGRPEMGRHQSDPVDAAVLLLPATSSAASRSLALDCSTIAETADELDGSRYLLLGYPANRVQADRRRAEVSSERKPLISSEVPDEMYARMEYDKRRHVLLRWRSEWQSTAGNHHARNLEGVSGGGIWRFDPRSPDVPPRLIATFTELPHRRGAKVLVGTRIHLHSELADELLREIRRGLG
jgi:hypothetical protein